MHRFAQVAVCGCILWTSIAYLRAVDARKPLTLPAAIAEARTNNPQMRALEAAVLSAKGGIVTARTWANPELTVTSGVRRTREEDSYFIGFNGGLSLMQPIRFPGKRTLEVALAQADTRLRQVAVEAFVFQISMNVSQAFYELLAAQKIVEVRKEQVDSAQTFLESANKRVESGFTGEFEAIKGETDFIAARAALRDAEARVTAAQIALNTLLARPPMAPLVVVGALSNLMPRGGLSDFIGLAMARNPALRALEVEAQKSGMSLRLARMGRLPDFAIGPSIEYFKEEQIVALSASVPLPLWDRKKGEIRSASAEQKRIIAEIARQRLEIAGAVAQATAALNASQDQLALYSTAFLDRMRRFVRQAEKGYAQNATTLILYLDAKRTYFDTLAAYYTTLERMAASRVALESAIGVPLSL